MPTYSSGHMHQSIGKGFLHTHVSQGLEIKPSLLPFVPNSASPITPSHPFNFPPLPSSGESLGNWTPGVEWLEGHPVRNRSRAASRALRLPVFRRRGGRLQRPVPLQPRREAANTRISISSRLLKSNSLNLSKLQPVGGCKAAIQSQGDLLAKTFCNG